MKNKKAKKTPHTMQLACHVKGDDAYITVGHPYCKNSDVTYVKTSKTFDLAELINEDIVQLELTQNTRNTRDTSYTKLKITNKVNFPVKEADVKTGKVISIDRGTYTYKESVYDFKDSSLIIEVKSKEIIYLFKYYNSKTKTIDIPLKDFSINQRTDWPVINFKKHIL